MKYLYYAAATCNATKKRGLVAVSAMAQRQTRRPSGLFG